MRELTTQEQIDYVTVHFSDSTYKELADSFGINISKVWRIAKRLGLKHSEEFKNRKSLVGKRFGRLFVVKKIDNEQNSGGVKYECLCDCGNTHIVSHRNLYNGSIKSCGCLLEDFLKSNTTHGGAGTKLYYVWNAARSRCFNPKDKGYKNYGGRGVTMCDEWANDFGSFQQWAYQNGYEEDKGLTIDRIDNNGNYCPENCRWVDQMTQCNNMRRNVYVTYMGKRQTLAQWARELNRQYESLRDSYYNGTFPPTKENAHRLRNKLIEYQGKRLTMKQWAEELNVDYSSIKHRVKRGTFPPTEENAHKRRNKLITYKGKSLTMNQWANELGITYNALKNKVYRGQFPPK